MANHLKRLFAKAMPSVCVMNDLHVICALQTSGVVIIEAGSVCRFDGWCWQVFKGSQLTGIELGREFLENHRNDLKVLK